MAKPENKERSYVGGVILRLFLLNATVVAVLAIGQYRYGWKPLGPKIHADQVGHNGAATIPAPVKEESLENVLSEAMRSGTAEQVKTEATPTPSPSPSPSPTPTPKEKKAISKQDQDELGDLLKKAVK
jgi:hypothetical protein